VAQTAAKLILEPIFEADLEPNAFGYRPKRSAQDAIQKVDELLHQGYTDIVDADLSKYFDTIPHSELMQCVARRIVDKHMLHLIKMWLKVPVEERDEKGKKRLTGGKDNDRGTPQGGVIYARVSSDRQKENHTICSQLAALEEYAGSHGYLVPPEWRFQDEGYSGATLLRPGLEALRDLAAAGHIEVALVYSPDRLSRKYAYQVLLAEELSRCGVELVFLKAPSGSTPEDQLLVQFQGMIAEYERAQIAERSRRGKRHRAHQGSINVLSGAPYGYRYVKKSDTAAAYYEVVESEAAVVRQVYEVYTQQGLSINAIARMLNERQVPTRTETTRWERSTVWGLLRNPAYRGRACYGKTELRPRQRITRPLRQRNGLASRDSANHERPRQDWIEIAVPALVSEETFALAQEQLEQNKRHSPRRTIEPTLLQGMLVCERCGYGLYRTCTQTSARRLCSRTCT
jgi:site-specific DNA recombinase